MCVGINCRYNCNIHTYREYEQCRSARDHGVSHCEVLSNIRDNDCTIQARKCPQCQSPAMMGTVEGTDGVRRDVQYDDLLTRPPRPVSPTTSDRAVNRFLISSDETESRILRNPRTMSLSPHTDGLSSHDSGSLERLSVRRRLSPARSRLSPGHTPREAFEAAAARGIQRRENQDEVDAVLERLRAVRERDLQEEQLRQAVADRLRGRRQHRDGEGSDDDDQ